MMARIKGKTSKIILKGVAVASVVSTMMTTATATAMNKLGSEHVRTVEDDSFLGGVTGAAHI